MLKTSLLRVATIAVGFFVFNPASANNDTVSLVKLLKSENAIVGGLSAEKLQKLKEFRAENRILARLEGVRKSPSLDRPTLASINTSAPKKPVTYADTELACLTEALYFEARGESRTGQMAVAEVILNRVKHKRYPNTVCGVVSQGEHRTTGCQFSYKCDGIPEVYRERQAFYRMGQVARLALSGALKKVTNGAVFYHHQSVNPKWSRSSKLRKTTKIGTHLFYRYSRG